MIGKDSQVVPIRFESCAYNVNMKRFLSLSSACAFALLLANGSMLDASAASAPQVVTVTASESNMFAPAQITVHVGQPVELKIVGQSGVHGIASSELGIPNTVITPGSTKTVTFTATKAGTYVLHCTIPCGPDHQKMAIVLKAV